MKARLAAATLLALATTASADPRPPQVIQVRQLQYLISPESRAVMERSAKFYGRLKSLAVRLNIESNVYRDGNNIPVNRSAVLQWERRGLLRFESQSTRERTIIDGNRIHQFWNGQYRSDQLSPGRKSDRTLSLMTSSSSFFDATTILSGLLRGKAPILTSLDEFTQVKSSLKPSQTVNGIACDLVEMSGAYAGDDGSLAEYSFWFAKSDGHLLRVVIKSFEEKEWRNIDDVSFEQQRFNPTFAASTFQVGLLK
jgi:hypothetical protein